MPDRGRTRPVQVSGAEVAERERTQNAAHLDVVHQEPGDLGGGAGGCSYVAFHCTGCVAVPEIPTCDVKWNIPASFPAPESGISPEEWRLWGCDAH